MPDIIEFGRDDVADILAFNDAAQEFSGKDFLYRYQPDRIVSDFDADRIVAVGCRGKDARITALSLCCKTQSIDFEPIATAPMIRAINPDSVYLGMNTIIEPSFRYPGLFQSLVRKRSEISLQKGATHLVAGISVENRISLGCSLAMGANIAGVHTCEGSLEFTVIGKLNQQIKEKKSCLFSIPRSDLPAIIDAISNSFVGNKYNKKIDEICFE